MDRALGPAHRALGLGLGWARKAGSAALHGEKACMLPACFPAWVISRQGDSPPSRALRFLALALAAASRWRASRRAASSSSSPAQSRPSPTSLCRIQGQMPAAPPSPAAAAAGSGAGRVEWVSASQQLRRAATPAFRSRYALHAALNAGQKKQTTPSTKPSTCARRLLVLLGRLLALGNGAAAGCSMPGQPAEAVEWSGPQLVMALMPARSSLLQTGQRHLLRRRT